MKRLVSTLFLLCAISFASIAAVYNVRDFGAKGDGKTIDSPAINAAIDAAAANGGGVIYFPAGTYASYSVRLASHIELNFETGAVLKAAEPVGSEGFDPAEEGPKPQYQDYGHSHWKNSLIWGIGLEDITFSGGGMIDGSNLSCGFGDTALAAGVGNKSISLKDCHHVIIKDITIYNGGHFCLLATGVDDLKISGITVDTMRDGLDIDCCRNVRVSDCLINSTFDDGLVLKASYGLERFVDTQDVTITGCNLSAYATGSILDATYKPAPLVNPHTGEPSSNRAGGRIKLGTESSGGFKNIAISSCTFRYCGGILIESMDGGVVEDIVINNITMREGIDSPLLIRLGERMRSPEGTDVGTIKRIMISNLNVFDSDSRYSTIISGTPGHKIEDVTLRNINFFFKGGMSTKDVSGMPPENIKAYPDPWMFGLNPAKGMLFRHIDGLTLDCVNFRYANPDNRPLFVSEDASRVVMRHVTMDKTEILQAK